MKKMGKSTIYMAMFNSYVCLPEGNGGILGMKLGKDGYESELC